MQRPGRLLVAAASLVLSPGGPAETFPREAVEGTTLERSVRVSSELELEALELVVDGERLAPPEGVEIELERSREWLIEDELGPPARGRPRTLVRTFVELGGRDLRRVAGPDGESDTERELGSELEGRAVRFALPPNDEGEHVASFEDGGGGEELLEGLREDLDLRAWLPPPGAEVEPGESWELGAEAWLALALPGGVELCSPSDTELDRRMARELLQGLEGFLRATYRGRELRGERELAVVELEVELEGEAAGPVPTDDEARVELAARVAHRLAGELLWDVAGGHLAGLALEGETELVERVRFSIQGHEREEVSRFRGETTWSIQVAK